MLKKRLLSIILVFALVVVSIPAFAADLPSNFPECYDYISIATFNDGTSDNVVTDDVLVSEKAYGDARGSVRYSFDFQSPFVAELDESLGSIKDKFPQPATGVVTGRENALVKLRFYSEDVGSKFILQFRSAGGTLKNTAYEVEVNAFGWQEYSYYFSEAIKGVGENVKHLTHIEISAPEENSAKNIYLDKVWFERVRLSEIAPDAPSGDGILVLDSLGDRSGSSTKRAIAKAGYTTNLRPGGASSYTMVNITDAYPDFQWDLKVNGKNADITGGTYADSSVTTTLAYNYLNMWVYSPRPQNGGLGVAFNGKGSAMAGVPAVFDWTGWKLISVPLKNADIKSTGLSMRILLTCGQYLGGSAFRYVDGAFAKDNTKRIGSSWNNWKSEGQFGIETMWLSKTQPAGANQTPNATINQKETPVSSETDDWVVYDVAQNLKIDGNRTEVLSGNGHLYKGSLRTIDGILGQRRVDLTFESDNKTIKTATFSRTGSDQYAGLYGTATLADAKKVLSEGYKYANLWIYSPGVSYDQFGNYSEYILSFNVYTSDTDESKHNRIGIGIPANWTGWKLVSIPLDEMKETNPTYYNMLSGGLRRVEIIANNANFCNDWKANNTAIDAANLKPDYGDTNPATNLSREVSGDYEFGIDGQGDFNTFADLKSFAEVERFWFSKEKPSESSAVDLKVLSDVVTVDSRIIKGYAGMTLADLRNALVAEKGVNITFKTKSGAVISDESQLASEGMIVVTSYADLTMTYSLGCDFLEFSDIKFIMNGNETKAAFDIGTLEAQTNVVCYNKNASADVTMILAQYEGNKLIGVDYAPESVSGAKPISASIELEKVLGTTLSVFIWNSVSGIKPIKEAIKLDIGKYIWMPSVFASGSVMQRDEELNIWGEAAPGAEIAVTLGGSTKTTIADDNGEWMVVADPISVENNPYTMTVTSSGGGSLEFTDILAGEVWLCSGQSNMEWQMCKIISEGADDDIKAQVADDIANSANSNIRLYNQTRNYSSTVMKDTIDGKWQECNSTNVNNFSAVAYYFGKNLEQQLGVPIGLISAARGGTTIQCFLDSETLAENNITYTHETDPERFAGSVFNSMVAPIIPYTLKGVLWYQGCSNAGAYSDTRYYALQNIWLNSWRNLWNNADMPFVITQLSAMNTVNFELVREAQYKFATDNENVEMAVTYDIGEKEQVHYCDKITAGYRLALAAAGGVYNMDIAYKYPSPEGFTVDGTTLTLTFKDVYDGLKLKYGDTSLNSFEILTSDGTWVAANAEITGNNTVTVTDGTNIPVGVRAGFKPYAEPMYNLYNSADLLATPFRLTK